MKVWEIANICQCKYFLYFFSEKNTKNYISVHIDTLRVKMSINNITPKRRQLWKDCLRPILSVCYDVKLCFKKGGYKTLAASFSITESPVNQGFFCPYYVTRARRFLMRSATCLRVIRFRQSGQYLTLFDFDTKNMPHSVQRFLSSVLKSSA